MAGKAKLIMKNSILDKKIRITWASSDTNDEIEVVFVKGPL